MKRLLHLLALFALTLLAACGYESYGQTAQYPVHAKPDWKVVMPAGAPYISQTFYAVTSDGHRGHEGIDIWERKGQPIIAAAPGTVTRSDYEPAYGNVIHISHGFDQDGLAVRTVYKHLDSRVVEVGDTVARGQQIGTMGESGLLSALVHLHFEVNRKLRHGWRPNDPHQDWVDGRGRVTCFVPGNTYPNDRFAITYPLPCH